MKKHTRWTEDRIARLKKLIEQKVSLARAAVIMGCPQASVQIQARRLGTPFAGVRKVKSDLKARVAAAEEKAGIPRDSDKRFSRDVR